MKTYTKNWKEKAVRKENLITQVIFDMGYKKGNSQAENRGQIKEEHLGRKDSMNKGKEEESSLWLCGIKDNALWKSLREQQYTKKVVKKE